MDKIRKVLNSHLDSENTWQCQAASDISAQIAGYIWLNPDTSSAKLAAHLRSLAKRITMPSAAYERYYATIIADIDRELWRDMSL